jgi:peptidoglycan hydrolase-like protein with peptidoglycan-binding domain
LFCQDRTARADALRRFESPFRDALGGAIRDREEGEEEDEDYDDDNDEDEESFLGTYENEGPYQDFDADDEVGSDFEDGLLSEEESPAGEMDFEDESAEDPEAERLEAELWLAENEASPAGPIFPSGVRLPIVPGPDGKGEEHYDPSQTGNPLLDTSAPQRDRMLSRNFTVGELAQSGSRRFDKARIDPRLVECLQKIRDHLGRTVRVTSGYRSVGYNKEVYARRNQKPTESRHSSGQAADIRIEGMSGMEIARAAIEACGCDIAVGIGRNEAHVDVRGTWARWSYEKDAASKSAVIREIDAFRSARCGKGASEPASTPPVTATTPVSGLRQRIVDVARGEWEKWGRGRKKETQPEMLATLRDYWSAVGQKVRLEDLRDPKWQRENPWSAAFVSWVMRTAGAGTRFSCLSAHRLYIAAAKKNRQSGGSGFWAYRISEVKPEPGDVVCADRACCEKCECNGATYDNIDDGHRWCTHGDIVIEVHPGEVRVLGGNADHSVDDAKIQTDSRGFVIPDQRKCRYFAIIKVREDGATESAPSSPTSSGSTLDLSRAVRFNRDYATKLAWDEHRTAILRVLAFVNVHPSDEQLATAVAEWQRAQGLEVDGILGPKTWKALRGVLGLAPRPASPTSPATIPPPGGPKVPDGFRTAGKGRGLARYADFRLDDKLLELRQRSLVQITDAELDIFQRIANVETSGHIQGINTWDSAVVSSGFMQWTLRHGELQEWIALAPAAYRRYGIELEPSRRYTWGNDRHSAIVGAPTTDELRWNGWAERFYLSGLDDEIIVAEVDLARKFLGRHLRGLSARLKKLEASGAFFVFQEHYDRSPYLRGIFQAAFNNLPVAAADGTARAVRAANREGTVSTDRFVELYKKGILDAYEARKNNGRRIVSETARGARLDR